MKKIYSELRFSCSYLGCGRLFKTKFSMKRHMILHNKEKNYICENCGKQFALSQYLKEHSYVHTNILPFMCGVNGCKERFRQAGKLSLHRRTHEEYSIKHYYCPSIFINKSGDFKNNSKNLVNKFKRVQQNSTNQNSLKKTPFGENLKTPEISSIKINSSDDFAERITDNSGNEIILSRKNSEIISQSIENEGYNDIMSLDVFIRYLKNIDTNLALYVKPVLPKPYIIQSEENINSLHNNNEHTRQIEKEVSNREKSVSK